ncbi:MAG: SNF2 helicase associated domain-containing protein, partial [bacterium]
MLLTKTDLRNATTTSLLRRSERLYQQSAVTIFDLKETSVQGRVQDAPYRYRDVSIRQTPGGKLSAQCSCYNPDTPCLHIVAVLLAYLDEMERAGHIDAGAPSWEDYLKHLPQLHQRNARETEAQITKLLFFIQLNPKKWRLQPMPTYIKKNGELGRRSRLQFGYDGALYGDVEATSVELKAINAMKHRLRASGNSYGYSADYFEFDYGEEAGFILDMLAESRLHLEEGERPLRAINSASQLFFELSNGVTGSAGRPAYQFFPQLQLNGHPEKLDDNYRILTSRPFWMLKGEKIFRVENSFPAPYLLPFTRKGYQLQIPSEKVEAFLQGFVPHLKHDIKLVLPENLSLQTAREMTGRRLYLREQNETLCVEPRFVYGDIEVGNLQEHQVNIPALSNGANGHSQTLWRVERDHTAEAAIHEALVAAGLKLDESREFYAPNLEPLVWLFDELPKLAQTGFEIFGEETLKRHRLNRATPNVRVAVSSDIDWFD